MLETLVVLNELLDLQGWVPEPVAMRMILEGLISTTESSSSLVIESIIKRKRLILAVASFSWPLGMRLELRPGIMLTT